MTLTKAEREAVRNARFWSNGWGKGVALSPHAAVAGLRGAVWSNPTGDDRVFPAAGRDWTIGEGAIKDVARAFGYKDGSSYLAGLEEKGARLLDRLENEPDPVPEKEPVQEAEKTAAAAEQEAAKKGRAGRPG